MDNIKDLIKSDKFFKVRIWKTGPSRIFKRELCIKELWPLWAKVGNTYDFKWKNILCGLDDGTRRKIKKHNVIWR